MSEEPDGPMNFLTNPTGLTTYRVFLVSICVVSLTIWIETIAVLGLIFFACLPGIFNEQLKAQYGEQQRMFFIPGRFIAPYRLFIFVWNGFRSQKG